jgi:hypothetical protein
MKKPSRFGLAFALAAGMSLPVVGLVGCGAQPGNTLVKIERGTTLTEDKPREVEARRDGMVALYATNDLTPKVTYEVKKGDKVGFRRASDGGIVAYAGGNETTVQSDPVFERTFYWKFQDEK